MRGKNVQLILIAVIAVLAAYLLVRNGNRTHYALPQLAAMKTGDITKLELKEPAVTIDLEKRNGS